jgi:hypothetical protein
MKSKSPRLLRSRTEQIVLASGSDFLISSRVRTGEVVLG